MFWDRLLSGAIYAPKSSHGIYASYSTAHAIFLAFNYDRNPMDNSFHRRMPSLSVRVSDDATATSGVTSVHCRTR